MRASKLIPQVKSHLYRVMSLEGRAADLLLLASSQDDWDMGKIAVKQLSESQILQIKTLPEGFEGFFEKLRPEWRGTLIDLIFFAIYNQYSTRATTILLDWNLVATRFVPPPPDKRKAE